MLGGWETAFGFGALALLITLAYGVYHTRHVSKASERAGEAGAKRLYDNPGESDAAPSGAQRRRVPPLIWIMAGLLVAWLAAIIILQRTGVVDVDPMAHESGASLEQGR
ncbi:hypothetical protein ASE17_19700 [Phenylobacterium sp. Root77]|jgi:hypothetical protein|uniref:hypothetical protein n=1 Tax=unclassified Phenylobacterium TaxID=2640670 RepID=UPI0006F2DD5A|nr:MULTISPECIES: hypothetical protein [unclassified Phenylobacterium]KQW67006.1 hypothetical protein ASC73_17905 [Phenylobacterium sp. Root1277]KQW89699.1 hypothetical protein ASC79_18810 [Phenylobacterium sp. Root1290]KRC43433.1 hypothetical protein ASE17_19700 [Phenylobacterium sp. Root77]